MRKIEETFQWQIRKHKDGALYECDVFFDIVDPSWIRTLPEKITAPIKAMKFETVPENATEDQIKEISTRTDEMIKRANDESGEILLSELAPKFSKKNKDMTFDEVIAVFKDYPAVLNKFMIKWHEVCFKQTFRGLELDKDS